MPPCRIRPCRNQHDNRRSGEALLVCLPHPFRDLPPVRRITPDPKWSPRHPEPVVIGGPESIALLVFGRRTGVDLKPELTIKRSEDLLRSSPLDRLGRQKSLVHLDAKLRGAPLLSGEWLRDIWLFRHLRRLGFRAGVGGGVALEPTHVVFPGLPADPTGYRGVERQFGDTRPVAIVTAFRLTSQARMDILAGQ